MNTCETKTGTCGEVPPNAPIQSSEGQCKCGCGGDPILCVMHAWAEAFCQAKKEAMVDILKSKIQKAWGSKMDKIADAVIDAMETKKTSMMAMSKAKADLKAKLESILKKD